MASIINRRCVVGILAAAPVVLGRNVAHGTAITRGIYPVATCAYQDLYVAQALGYFKDEGLDSRLVQGGSGVKTREIVASGQGDFGLADFVHPMLLTNKGRPARALTAVDRRAGGLQFIIRADLYAAGITDLGKFVRWKRPDGRRPIIGVSSLGGTKHVWCSYFMDQLGYGADAVTWLGVGNVDTMLGSLKTKQVDVLIGAFSLVGQVEEQGYGKLIYNGSDPADWDKIIGGSVPVTVNFCLQSRIETAPALVQAWTNGLVRAAHWIGAHTPDEIYGVIEPFVGSTSRTADILEITEAKSIGNDQGSIDQAAFDRGGRVWFREMTGVSQVPFAQAYAPQFVQTALERYPG